VKFSSQKPQPMKVRNTGHHYPLAYLGFML